MNQDRFKIGILIECTNTSIMFYDSVECKERVNSYLILNLAVWIPSSLKTPWILRLYVGHKLNVARNYRTVFTPIRY